MRYLLVCLALISMSCIQDDGDEDSKRQEMVGFWFPCEIDTSGAGNQACDKVDDDGMHYTEDDSVYRIEGALAYAKVKMGDTTVGPAFDIRVPELVFFGERESVYGTYALVGDSLRIKGVESANGQVMRSSFKISLADGFLTFLDGNRVVKRFRKYAGKATLVTRAQWEAALE